MIDCEPTVSQVPNLPLRTMPDSTRIVYVLPPNHPVPSHSNELNSVVRRRQTHCGRVGLVWRKHGQQYCTLGPIGEDLRDTPSR
jgi:hypothetical protein